MHSRNTVSLSLEKLSLVFIPVQEKKHTSLSLVLACESKTLATCSKEQRKTLGLHKAVLCSPQKGERVPLMLYVSVTVFSVDINRQYSLVK